jgi:hypothetical protein
MLCIDSIALHDSQQELTNLVVANCAHSNHLEAKLRHVDRDASGRSCDGHSDFIQNGKVLPRWNLRHWAPENVDDVNPKRPPTHRLSCNALEALRMGQLARRPPNES